MMSEALYQLAFRDRNAGNIFDDVIGGGADGPSFPVATQVRATEPSWLL